MLVASGIRMDLAQLSPEYVRELAAHHVGGHLKVAPEHTDPDVLELMKKPAIDNFERLRRRSSRRRRQTAGKPKQYLVPYFIASHPGSDLHAMIDLAVFLKRNGYRPDQVQDFIPAPFDIATCMYYTGIDPFTKQAGAHRAGTCSDRKLQRALMQFFKPENYFEVREALIQAGRGDLIGGCDGLIPAQPAEGGDRGPTEAGERGGSRRPLPHGRQPGEGRAGRRAADAAAGGNTGYRPGGRRRFGDSSRAGRDRSALIGGTSVTSMTTTGWPVVDDGSSGRRRTLTEASSLQVQLTFLEVADASGWLRHSADTHDIGDADWDLAYRELLEWSTSMRHVMRPTGELRSAIRLVPVTDVVRPHQPRHQICDSGGMSCQLRCPHAAHDAASTD